jgi:diguanylate cyclase
MRKRSRLGVKFVLLTVGILSLTLLINASWVVQQQKQQLQAQLLERGRILGHFLSHVSTEAILAFDFVALESYVRDVNKRQDIIFSIILDKHGNPLTNYIDNDNPQIRSLADGGKFSSVKELLQVARQNPDITVETFAIQARKKLLGSAVIGISRERIERELMDYFIIQLSIYSTIILFLSLAIYFVFRINVLQPIGQLINGARRVADGYFDEPVDISSDDEMGKLTTAFNSMMSEVRKDRELLNFQANFDALTGLPNRMQAIEHLEGEISRAQRENRSFAVAFIDLNNFKYVNDTMGHQAGDKLLKSLSTRFRSVLRDSDILARLGGDEFLLILPTATRPTESREATHRLINSLTDPIMLGDREVFIRCSMGIAIYPNDGRNAEELMANADNAMYQSKLSHTEDICFFAPEMNQAIKERMELEHDLHLALERDEFRLYFQPIIDAKERCPIGAEVLLRWQHPERGMIHPLRFIPLAESTGRILQIGQWTLNQSLQIVRHLLEKGLNPGFTTINVSRVQLTRDFETTVQKALDDANLPPSRLRLEVTESALMEHIGELPDMLRRLDSIGVKLVLDDFGTGFSSLNYLKHFPFHTLKIDKSFIDSVPESDDAASLVRGIIAMGRSLGLNVVSEGVEREEQYRFVVGSGVDSVQGYLFARPMTLEDFSDYLQQYSDNTSVSHAKEKGIRKVTKSVN